MHIPDPVTNDLEGVGFFLELAGYKRGKADTEDGDGLFDWTANLLISLNDAVIDSAPDYLPGAAAMLQRAIEGKGSGEQKHEPIDASRNINITIRDNAGDVVVGNANAEIRLIQLRTTEADSRYRLRLLIPGLLSTSSGALLEVDRRSISLDSSPVQVSLPIEAGAEAAA